MKSKIVAERPFLHLLSFFLVLGVGVALPLPLERYSPLDPFFHSPSRAHPPSSTQTLQQSRRNEVRRYYSKSDHPNPLMRTQPEPYIREEDVDLYNEGNPRPYPKGVRGERRERDRGRVSARGDRRRPLRRPPSRSRYRDEGPHSEEEGGVLRGRFGRNETLLLPIHLTYSSSGRNEKSDTDTDSDHDPESSPGIFTVLRGTHAKRWPKDKVASKDYPRPHRNKKRPAKRKKKKGRRQVAAPSDYTEEYGHYHYEAHSQDPHHKPEEKKKPKKPKGKKKTNEKVAFFTKVGGVLDHLNDSRVRIQKAVASVVAKGVVLQAKIFLGGAKGTAEGIKWASSF